MDDILCPFCGEPWDIYGVFYGGDITKAERRRFTQMEGCPTCEFGTKTGVLLSGEEQKAAQDEFLDTLYTTLQ